MGRCTRARGAARPCRAPCECGSCTANETRCSARRSIPTTYDYRRAALDSIHFARRLTGSGRTYAAPSAGTSSTPGAVEMQKRLAPHAPLRHPRHHAPAAAQAGRGRHLPPGVVATLRPADLRRGQAAASGTPTSSAYVDPTHRGAADRPGRTRSTRWATRQPTRLRGPARARIDARGIEQRHQGCRTLDPLRHQVRHQGPDRPGASPDRTPQRAHFDRLHAELSVTAVLADVRELAALRRPAGRRQAGTDPGPLHRQSPPAPHARLHRPTRPVSRQWSGKTLTDHRADNRAWVRAVLAGALDNDDDQGDSPDRYSYSLARPDDPDVPSTQIRIMRAIAVHTERQAALRQAKHPPGAVRA